MVLLAGAALLGRSFERLEHQDLGYVSDHLSILSYSWNAKRYDSTTKMLALSDRILARLRAIPGVTASTPIVIPPLLGVSVWQGRFDTEGQTDIEAKANPETPIEMGGAAILQDVWNSAHSWALIQRR